MSTTTINIGPLHKNFLSSGAKDHPNFWIHGASNFIPNMMKFIELVHTPKLVDISEFANDNSETVKNIIMKCGSDKHFHDSHILYSYILQPDKELNILETVNVETLNVETPTIELPKRKLKTIKDYFKAS